jgi:hypothetical protein
MGNSLSTAAEGSSSSFVESDDRISRLTCGGSTCEGGEREEGENIQSRKSRAKLKLDILETLAAQDSGKARGADYVRASPKSEDKKRREARARLRGQRLSSRFSSSREDENGWGRFSPRGGGRAGGSSNGDLYSPSGVASPTGSCSGSVCSASEAGSYGSSSMMYSPRTDLSEIFDEGEKIRGREWTGEREGTRGREREREREREKKRMEWKGGRVREGRKRERGEG